MVYECSKIAPNEFSTNCCSEEIIYIIVLLMYQHLYMEGIVTCEVYMFNNTARQCSRGHIMFSLLAGELAFLGTMMSKCIPME